jgi:hypothetical protein
MRTDRTNEICTPKPLYYSKVQSLNAYLIVGRDKERISKTSNWRICFFSRLPISIYSKQSHSMLFALCVCRLLLLLLLLLPAVLPMHTTAFETKEYPQCWTAPIGILGPTIDALQISVHRLQRRKVVRLHFVLAATLIDIMRCCCCHTVELRLVVKRVVSTLQGHSRWSVVVV